MAKTTTTTTMVACFGCFGRVVIYFPAQASPKKANGGFLEATLSMGAYH